MLTSEKKYATINLQEAKGIQMYALLSIGPWEESPTERSSTEQDCENFAPSLTQTFTQT